MRVNVAENAKIDWNINLLIGNYVDASTPEKEVEINKIYKDMQDDNNLLMIGKL